MTEIEKQIEAAIRQLGLSDQEIKRLPPSRAMGIVEHARQKLVNGQPRAWWLSLREPCTVIDYPDASGCKHLTEHWFHPDPFCWFIPETEKTDLPVYEAEVAILPRLLSECSFFEYYLVSKDYSFLLIENDHNQIIASGLLGPR